MMEEAAQRQSPAKRTRGFILGSLSFGHGVSHLYDQAFPFFMPDITRTLGMSTLQVASILGIRQVGFGAVNLATGPLVDMLKRYWGLILTGCILLSAVSFALIGASPNYWVLAIAVIFVSMPGALWHLPATAALSQRFPERRAFAISMHGFGSSIGTILAPIVAGALLGAFFWRNVLFMYAAPALILAAIVWWALRDVGKDGTQETPRRMGARFRESLVLLKNPVVLGLIAAGGLRGVGLNAVANWTPFYLKDAEDGLGMGHFEAGFYYALLTGMGITAGPVLGTLADRVGRKAVLLPGLVVASGLSLIVVSAGDGILLALVLAGMGLFSFSLHHIIQAAILDAVGRGTEATTTGLLFGLNGLIGGASPFLASVIIDHLGGFGSIYYYAGIMTAITAALVVFIPMRPARPAVEPGG